MNRLRNIAISVSILTTITVSLLAAAELGSYLTLRLRHPASGKVLAAENSAKNQAALAAYGGAKWVAAYWIEHYASAQVEYAPYVEWRSVPFAGEYIVIDAQHHRRTFYTQCGVNTYTIWMFGGSTLWGYGVPDWDSIPSFLAKAYRDAGRPVCVRNYGQQGWASTQEVVELELALRGARRPPDLVIFLDGINDTLATWYNSTPELPLDFAGIKRRLDTRDPYNDRPFGYLFRTYTVQILQDLTARLIPRRSATESPHPVGPALTRQAAAIIATYERDTKIVRGLSQIYGFSSVFFWQPVLSVGDKPLTTDERSIRDNANDRWPGLLPLFERTYNIMRAEHRPSMYYIANVFKAQSQTMYIDFLHTGPNGNRLVAAQIYQLLH